MATKTRKPKWKPKFDAGQEVWFFDRDRRVYERDEAGHSVGGPLYHEHFVRRVRITEVGETGYKVDGSPYGIHGLAFERCHFSEEERLKMIWDDARYRIGEEARRSDIKTLQAVAELVGFRPEGI